METVASQGDSRFLLEAWESLAAIEEALSAWEWGAVEEARSSLSVICHRLRGSSALYGWNRLAAVAEGLEDLTLRQPAEQLAAESPFAMLFEEAMATVPAVLDRIAAEASDELPEAVALVERLTATLAQEAGSENGGGEHAAEAAAASRSLRVEAALRTFRSDQAEDLEFFVMESEEHLAAIEGALNRVHSAPRDLEPVDVLFRRIHTLKGAALMVGCHPLGELAHRAEDLLVEHQRRRLPLRTADIEALGLTSRSLRAMLDLLTGDQVAAGSLCQQAEAALTAAQAVDFAKTATPTAFELRQRQVEPPAAVAEEPAAVEKIRLRVDRDQLDSLLELVGELLVERSRIEHHLEQLAAVGEQMDWNRRRLLGTVDRFSEKYLDPSLGDDADPQVGEAAVARVSESGTPTAADAEAGGQVADALDFAELELDRYDDFNFLARRVTEMADDFSLIHRELDGKLGELRSSSEHLQKLSRRLRSGISRTRLVPIAPLFERLRRLVEEVAEETGKSVAIELRGTDTKADGALIERLFDPLLHLLQNAVIHGVESPDERRAAGKSPVGEIVLRAAAHGASLRLEIEDDGAGIDVEKIREVAIRQGVSTAETIAELGHDELCELIFVPGLSTLDRVTRRAGRGVGMDAVRDTVLRLEGDLEVTSNAGEGSRFELTLPASLVLSEALMVNVGEQTYGVALPAIQRVLELPASEVEAAAGSALVLGEEEVELFSLGAVLGLATAAQEPPAATVPVLLVRLGGRRLALAVDAVEGIAEIVVRPFDELLAGTELFSGGALMPDGRVVLLMDSAALFALPENRPILEPIAAARSSASDAAETGAARVLLVDDSLSVRRVLSRALGRAGFEIVTAADGIEALETLRERAFDAVVTDLEMPRLNGYELIEDLRRRFPPARLPIFVITTRASRKHAELAHRLGASGYLYKPIDERRLASHLREATARCSPGPPLSAEMEDGS